MLEESSLGGPYTEGLTMFRMANTEKRPRREAPAQVQALLRKTVAWVAHTGHTRCGSLTWRPELTNKSVKLEERYLKEVVLPRPSVIYCCDPRVINAAKR